MLRTNNFPHIAPKAVSCRVVLGKALRHGHVLSLASKNRLEALESVVFVGGEGREVMRGDEFPEGGEGVLVGESVEGEVLLGHSEVEAE